MYKRFFRICLLITTILVVAACSNGSNESSESKTKDQEATNDTLRVITSFTLLEDMVREVGGERVDIHNLVPIGTDPHEYDPLPDDIKAATDADILFFNGLNLEGGDTGWFAKVMDSVHQDWDVAFELSSGIEPLHL